MDTLNAKLRTTGFITFFISGICATSTGVVVSLLQDQLGFAFGMTGTLLSMMTIGNLLAGFVVTFLTVRIGMKAGTLILTAGYAVGYLLMSATGWIPLLMLSFLLVGFGKGSAINTCTILVSNNSANRTRGMNILHSSFAFGAFLCPFLISLAAARSGRLPMVLLGVLGAVMWLMFAMSSMSDGGAKKAKTDWSFLKSGKFWLLVALLFCQNGTEISVTGWMVTYFKENGILSGALSAYTVTVIWLATLLLRMIYAFVLPIKRAERAMIRMSIGCFVFYFALMQVHSQWPAILLLFAFAASMAGLNPTAVSCAGRMTSVASMGILLPAASSGAIVMPYVIGIVADAAGIQAGMFTLMVPCVGLLIFSVILAKVFGTAEA